MSALLDLYRAQFRTTIATQLQYRAALVIWLIGMVLEPLVYLVVWTTVARSGGEVGGFAGADFAAYFIATMLVNHLTFTWIAWEFEWRIRQGSLSPILLRPIHPIHKDIAENVTYKLLTLPIVGLAAVGLALAFGAAWRPEPWALAVAAPAPALAMAVRFVIEWTLALVAFWMTRVMAVNQVYYVALLFLSGQAAPLTLLPGPAQALAAVLPFRWLVAFPVELALGRLTPAEAATGLAMQAVWLAISLLAMGIIWRAGLRRYSAVGA